MERRRLIDLNCLTIDDADGPDVPLADPSTSSENGDVSVYFRRIEEALLGHIDRAEVVVGCVAWLSNDAVLRALVRKKAVAIVVQKEDFLRPDFGVPARGYPHAEILRRRYRVLPQGLDRHEYPGLAGQLSTGGDQSVSPVRCVGQLNAEHRSGFPRSHHKFAVFCRVNPPGAESRLCPYEVWTGSYNWSETATRSLENAVVLRDHRVVAAFYDEWAQVFALSEPLDWTSDYVYPEYRLGT